MRKRKIIAYNAAGQPVFDDGTTDRPLSGRDVREFHKREAELKYTGRVLACNQRLNQSASAKCTCGRHER